MRIIAGTAKGRRLVAPSGKGVRPTTDRVKEALFSSLQPRLHGAIVLDLYAGSGALGLEAVSRGARHAVLVERWSRALQAIATNIEATGFGDRVTTVADDVDRAVATLSGPFDVVLADPPYDLDDDALAEVLGAVVPLLAEGAVVVVERAGRDGPVPWPAGLRGERSRRYGDTTLHVATVEHPVVQEDA
jgi:16S rRNA (guanine966-N2)-methyltransferase